MDEEKDMIEINDLDLKGFMVNAINNVFDTMLSMEVETSDADSAMVVEGNRIVGSVAFAGQALGSVSIHVTDQFARIITAAMLDMEPDEIESEDETLDVIGELSNMIGGDIKSRLCDVGLQCQLSIPTITKGNNFTIDSKGYMKNERISFRNGSHNALSEVFVRKGD